MPLGNLTGALGKKRAAHLLRRTSFGASIADIDLFASLTAQEAFARLLSEELPNPPLPLDPATNSEWVLCLIETCIQQVAKLITIFWSSDNEILNTP